MKKISKAILPLFFAVFITLGLAIVLQGALGITINSDLNFGAGKKITGLPVPTGNTEAATKEYVDSAVVTGGGVPSGYSILGATAVAPAGYTYTGETFTGNPSPDTWLPKAPMPTARYGLAAASPGNGKIYAIGGYNGSVLATNEKYETGEIIFYVHQKN